MKNSITKKLILYFTAILLIFAVVIGTVFTILFTNTMIQHNKADLQRRAEAIAGTLSQFLEGNAPASGGHGQGHGQGQGNGNGGFGAFLKLADDIAMGEVWLVDEDSNLITQGEHAGAVTYDALPADGDRLIQNALNGKSGFSETFSEIVGKKTITICVPAVGSDGRVLAAVLLHAPLRGMQGSVASGLGILVLSVLAALILSMCIAVLLSKRFIRPIRLMNQTAKKIADGDYEQTRITQKDEIGELAQTIDELSVRLFAAQSQREQLEQERQSFYADVSHELRTPITVMRGSLEALRDGKADDETKKQEYYNQMIGETQYMQNMVNDLLDFSRLKNKDYVLEMEPLNVSDVLSDTVRSMRRIAEKKKLEIVFENPCPMIELTGNYEKLRQMFLIVMDNAVKFSPENDAVLVQVEQKADRHIISICDHGPGVDEKVLPHIFERFYKENSLQNQGGTGIGLAIAKQIADRHNIKIQVERQKENGTCFVFDIVNIKQM